nr:unnamed protein product [Digitaria exilis]
MGGNGGSTSVARPRVAGHGLAVAVCQAGGGSRPRSVLVDIYRPTPAFFFFSSSFSLPVPFWSPAFPPSRAVVRAPPIKFPPPKFHPPQHLHVAVFLFVADRCHRRGGSRTWAAHLRSSPSKLSPGSGCRLRVVAAAFAAVRTSAMVGAREQALRLVSLVLMDLFFGAVSPPFSRLACATASPPPAPSGASSVQQSRGKRGGIGRGASPPASGRGQGRRAPSAPRSPVLNGGGTAGEKERFFQGLVGFAEEQRQVKEVIVIAPESRIAGESNLLVIPGKPRRDRNLELTGWSPDVGPTWGYVPGFG